MNEEIKKEIKRYEEYATLLSEKDRNSPLSGFYAGLMAGFKNGVKKTMDNPDLSEEEKKAEIQRLYDIMLKGRKHFETLYGEK